MSLEEKKDNQEKTAAVEEFSLSSFELKMENELIGLHQTLDGLLPTTPRKVIQFMGSKEEEGTSTIVREFAIVSVREFNRSVLLLDAGLSRQHQHDIFDITTLTSLEKIIQDGEPIDKALYQVGNSALFFCKLLRAGKPNPQLLVPSGVDNLFARLSKNFDYVIIDSPPAPTNFAVSLASAKTVNGVVLVIEAEKTRWPVVDNARKRIIDNGGNLLGIVLNKRRYHIPNFLYKHL